VLSTGLTTWHSWSALDQQTVHVSIYLSPPLRLGPLLVGLDLSPVEAARLGDEGLLVRCVGDVVVPCDTRLDMTLRAQCVAALLRRENVDPSAWVVGHEAALWVYRGRIETTPPPAPFAALERVVVLGSRGRTTRYYGTVAHRQSVVAADEIETHAGIRLTVPARTAADLLRVLPEPQALESLEILRQASAIEPEDVDACLRNQRGARGVSAARRTLRRWTESQRPDGFVTARRDAP
jgi:hypothetical protein